MGILSLGNIIPLGVSAICALLMGYIALKRPLLVGRANLALTLLATIGVALALMLPPDFILVGSLGRSFAITLALGALLLVFGALLLRDINGQQARWWWVGGVVWLVLVALIALVSPAFTVGERDWLPNLLRAPDVPGVVVLAGLLAAGALLPGWTLVAHDRATLPEVGNRALLWLFQSIAILCGAAHHRRLSPIARGAQRTPEHASFPRSVAKRPSDEAGLRPRPEGCRGARRARSEPRLAACTAPCLCQPSSAERRRSPLRPAASLF